jgi:hypothetical protein
MPKQTLRPGLDQEVSIPMKHIIPVVVALALASSLTGCAAVVQKAPAPRPEAVPAPAPRPERQPEPQPPSPPMAPEPVKYTSAELGLSLPASPILNWPDYPKDRAKPLAEVVNTPARFFGGQGEPLAAGAAIAVIASEEVLGEERSPRYVSDVVQRRLSSAGYRVVEREYGGFVGTENERVHRNTVELSAEQRAQALDSQVLANYFLFVHPIQDNSATAQPQYYSLPRYIPNEEWGAYETQVENVEERAAKYQAEVQQFLDQRQQKLDELLKRFQSKSGAWEDYLQRYENYRREHKNYTGQCNRTGHRPVSITPVSSSYFEIVDEKSAEKAEVAEEQISQFEQEFYKFQSVISAALPNVSKSNTWAEIGGPSPITKELLLAEQARVRGSESSELGTIYQYSISVRVVDARTLETVWYGQAECQNLSYLDAVDQVATSIVDNLRGKEAAK